MTQLRVFTSNVIFGCLVSAALAISWKSNTSDTLASYRNDASTNNLLDGIVTNLQQSSLTASQSLANFNTQLEDQANVFNNYLRQETSTMDSALAEAVNNALVKFNQVTSDLVQCVENGRESAVNLLNITASDIGACVTDSLEQFSNQFVELETLGHQATAIADETIQTKMFCLSKGNIFTVAGCLAHLLIDAQAKSLSIGGLIGVEIARIRLGLNSLPMTLSFCAGTQLAEAGISVAGIILDLSMCTIDTVLAD